MNGPYVVMHDEQFDHHLSPVTLVEFAQNWRKKFDAISGRTTIFHKSYYNNAILQCYTNHPDAQSSVLR